MNKQQQYQLSASEALVCASTKAKETLVWTKLSPSEFTKLQEYASYSNTHIKDVLNEFKPGGQLAQYRNDTETIEYEAFVKLLNLYLEAEVPEELCRHLFMSFIKRRKPDGTEFHEIPPSTSFPDQGKLSNLTHRITEKQHSIREKMTLITDRIQNTFGERFHTTKAGSCQNVSCSSPTEPSSPCCTSTPITPSGQTTLNSKQRPQLCETAAATANHREPQPHAQVCTKLSSSVESSRNSSRKSNCSSNGHVPAQVPASSSLPSPTRSSNKHETSATATARCSNGSDVIVDIATARVRLKDIVCYLSLLEGGQPADKLEFVFHLYDSDGNGYLDSTEMESIIEQMMNVARYLEWDTIELEPIVRGMMREIDYDNDGTVTLEEWKRGGLTTIPLLVLLGFDTEMKEDGTHSWKMRRFRSPAMCNICMQLLVAWGGKQGLSCTLCKYTVHERCVAKAPNNCISTYVKSVKGTTEAMQHHWVEGNINNDKKKCQKCKKSVKTFDCKHCRWCQTTIHTRCAPNFKPDCNFGPLATHILPPTSICPAVLDRPTIRETPSLKDTNELNHKSSDCHPQSFQINPPPNTKPLLVFINPKSGGKQGEKLYRKFQYLLNPRQVHNLGKGGPIDTLKTFKGVPRVQILCCGGDGTVGWVLEAMDKIYRDDEPRPPVAVLPLGTGNDLARCLNWGPGYDHEPLHKILGKIDKASPVMLDRWQITIAQTDSSEQGDSVPYNIINNYFSIGVDASIAHRFHVMREKHPEKFNSRTKNKLWYFEFGTNETLFSTCKNLHEEIDIVCDGVSLELSTGTPLEGIALLNIPSCYGGSNLWGESSGKNKRPTSSSSATDVRHSVQDIGDRLIEVVGLESAMAVGQIKAGLRASGRRLAQCSSVVIRTKKRYPMQIDGEPWMQPACTINITHKNQVPMSMAAEKHRRFHGWDWFKRRTEATED